MCGTWCQVLLDAGIKGCDAVVLGSGPPVGAELEADARILSAVLQVGVERIDSCSCWQPTHMLVVSLQTHSKIVPALSCMTGAAH